MYYENREHRTHLVKSAAHAARRIFDQQAQSYEALVWKTDSATLAAVDDGSIDEPWAEVAVIRIDVDIPILVDSIKFDLIKEVDKAIGLLELCEITDFNLGPTSLPRIRTRCGSC